MTGPQSIAAGVPPADQAPAATSADIVVTLVGTGDATALRAAIAAVRGSLPPGLRVLLVHPQEIDAGLVNGDDTVTVVAQPVAPIDRIPTVTLLPGDTFRTTFTMAERAGARAALVLGSDPEALSPGLLQSLVRPVLDHGIDLVAPLYERGRFEGLISSAVVYPLTRALYGKRVRGQLGLDFAFSSALAGSWRSVSTAGVSAGRPLWVIPQALADGFKVAEAHLGVPLPPATGPSDLSSTLSAVLSSLFFDVERRAPFWQKVRRSEPVPAFGEPSGAVVDGDPFDVQPFIESFQLAHRNLRDVWSLVLPPATLVELKRLTGRPAAQFRMPDELWAHVVYDFVLGHRVRTINRDHLLAALTPIYLAWVASHALEVGQGPHAVADEVVERLCLAYEVEKPYLLRRWRWPDRFNP